MEEIDTKLTVNLDGKDVTIDVLDIFESEEYNKEYIVYNILDLNNDQIFISILNKTEDSFSLDIIESDEEYKNILAMYKSFNEE